MAASLGNLFATRDVRFLVVSLFIAMACSLSPIIASAQSADETLEELEEQAFKGAAARAQPSIVRIETVGGVELVDNLLTSTGPTTGVVVSNDGLILSSSFNFAAKPASIIITTFDGRKFPARQVANDHLRMLTLLKIQADGLIPMTAADAESFQAGRWAIALGRTYDTEAPNISVGIISALKRVWGKALQTDAKVSPVNYGGPLVDLNGHALGILVPLSPEGHTATSGIEWYDSGIGFAIPYQDALLAVDRMKDGKDLKPGLLGIAFGRTGGVAEKPTIDRVQYGSPAQQAGLQAGDLITDVNRQPIRRVADFRQQLGTSYAGDSIELNIRRGEEKLEFTVQLVDELLPYESGYLGILPIRPASDEEPTGVTIRYVIPNSPAEQAGLKRRDRIISFVDKPILRQADLIDAVGRTLPGDTIRLTIIREQVEQTIDVHLGSIPNDLPSTDLPLHPPIEKSADDPRAGEEAPPTGRITETLPGSENSYWAYIPDDYNPRMSYGLIVWIHPGGETHEAICLSRWKTICDTQGLILLGPKSERTAWGPEHMDFIKEAIGVITTRYRIDPERKTLLCESSSGPFSQFLANQQRDLFKGIVLWNAPLAALPPEHQPDNRWQWFLGCREDHPQRNLLNQSTERLRQMKYPAVLSTWTGNADDYPPPTAVDELSRWIDSLDRL